MENTRLSHQFERKNYALHLCMVFLLVLLLFPLQTSGNNKTNLHELHIVVDTNNTIGKNIDLHSLRLVAGLIPPHITLYLWEYSDTLMPIKPAYTINAARTLPSSTYIADDKPNTLLNTLNHLIGENTSAAERKNVLLVTANTMNDTLLSSTETEQLAHTLLNNNTHFSVLQLNTQKTAPLYQLLTSISHGQNKAIAHAGPYSYELLSFIEQHIPLNYIPLHETLMKVDESINELTLVLFKQPNRPNDIEIIPPLQTPFTYTDVPKNINWIQSASFDLINIKKPSKGTWQVFSNEHIHHRIVIDANLYATATTFPFMVPSNSYQEINIEIKKDGKTILSPDIMNYVAMKVAQIENGMEKYVWFPADNGKNGDMIGKDGLFTVALKKTLDHGDYLFTIDIDGNSFQRQLRRHINVNKDLAWVHSEYDNTTEENITLIVPHQRFLKPESMVINASVIGLQETYDENIQRHNEYAWIIKTRNANKLEINLAGTSPHGKTSSIWLPPIQLENSTPTRSQTKINTHPEPSISHSENKQEDISPEPLQEMHEEGIIFSDSSGLSITLSLLLINLLFFGAIFFLYKRWNLNEASWKAQLEGRLNYD